MKKKYIATVHTLVPNKAPVQFVWDTHYLTNGLMSYWLDKNPVAEVPSSYLVTYASFLEPEFEFEKYGIGTEDFKDEPTITVQDFKDEIEKLLKQAGDQNQDHTMD